MEMKRLSAMLLVFIFAFCANHAHGIAATIVGLTLWGGNGEEEATWNDNGSVWDTIEHFRHVLGVSARPNGTLLNRGDTTLPDLPVRGDYYLYAEPGNLGSNPKLEVFLSDGSVLNGIFVVAGRPGVERSWARPFGSLWLSLGWAQGTADKVGSGMGPSGQDDFYLRLSIGVGGAVTGVSGSRVICQNLTTEQSVVIRLRGDATSWNCEKSGLAVRPGDRIRQTVTGQASQ